MRHMNLLMSIPDEAAKIFSTESGFDLSITKKEIKKYNLGYKNK